MQILKFGGTSLGTVDNIRRVAQIIDTSIPKVVVLSANGKSTDLLEEIIRSIETGESANTETSIDQLTFYYNSLILELFESDLQRSKARHALDELIQGIQSCINLELHLTDKNWIITRGEFFSTIIFTLYLEELGRAVSFLHATDFIFLNENGQPDQDRINWTFQEFQTKSVDSEIFVIQGFVCTDFKGNIETLGRGGSDLTASLLGAASEASVVQIWSDVDGFLNNDPGFVRGALPLNYLSFDEAAELAYFGARILHPATINPARIAGIPVLLKNTFNPDHPGTLISSKQQDGTVKAVAAKDQIYTLTIHSDRMLMAFGFLRKVFEIFERYETPVDLVTTSEVSISVTIDDPSHLTQIKSQLEQLGHVEISANNALVCVVGDHLSENRGQVGALFDALTEIPLRMISYGAAKNSISFLVRSEDKVATLEALNSLLRKTHQKSKSYV